MPVTETRSSSAHVVHVLTVPDQCLDTEPPDLMEQVPLPTRLADSAVIEAPPFTRVYISSPSSFGVHGLLKCAPRGTLQIITPVSVPIRCTVKITIAGCRAVCGEVFFCIKRGTVYQVGLDCCSSYEPDVAVGGLAIINALEEPFTVTRGHVLDVGGSALSILCKTMLVPGTWVRVESNGWILFGQVERVVAISMVACCLSVHLEAAFPADSTSPEPAAPPLIRSHELESA
jgi:hypothetical protein